MSLTLGLNSAISGLLTNQRALDNLSHNIANVNTPGFTRKVFNQESRVLAGNGAGVQVASITRAVDEGLLRSIRRELGRLGELAAQEDYYGRMQDLFGSPELNNSIAHTVNRLTEAIEALAVEPHKQVGQWQVVRTFEDAAIQMNQMSNTIQDLRVQADREINEMVRDINGQLATIADLNESIVRNQTVGLNATDLEDKRDEALNKLAEYMDISYFRRNDNSIVVFSGSGVTLLDNEAQKLTHANASVLKPVMTAGGGQLQPVRLELDGTEVKVNLGRLKGLFDLRDKVLPNLQAEMDELSHSLKTEINKLRNRGASYPTLNDAMQGTRNFLNPSTQAVTMSGGDVAITLFDTSGDEAHRTTLNTIMQAANHPANGPWAVTDVAETIEGWLQNGSPGLANAVATVDSGTGRLRITLNSNDLGLAFRDQRANVHDSKSCDNATAPLGLTAGHQMTVSTPDGALGTVTVAANETLNSLAAKFGALNGIGAEVVQIAGKFRLRVTHDDGRGMLVSDTNFDHGAKGELGLMASGAAAAGDVTISYDADAAPRVHAVQTDDINQAEAGMNVTGLSFSGDGLARSPSISLASAYDAVEDETTITLTVNGETANVVLPGDGDGEDGTITVNGVTVEFTGGTGGITAPQTNTFDVVVADTYTANGPDITAAEAALNLDGIAITGGGLVARPEMSIQVEDIGGTQTRVTFTVGGFSEQVTVDNGDGGTVGPINGVTLTFDDAVGATNATSTIRTHVAGQAETALADPIFEEVVDGFSHFFGLNDLLLAHPQDDVLDSRMVDGNWQAPVGGGTVQIHDRLGQLGGDVVIPSNASLQDIATLINEAMPSRPEYGTALLPVGYTVPVGSAGQMSVTHPQTGAVITVAVAAGDTLDRIAEKLNAASQANANMDLEAEVVDDPGGRRLRLTSFGGSPLTIGNTSGLKVQKREVAQAAVVPEGPGFRLRISHDAAGDMQITQTAGQILNLLEVGPTKARTSTGLKVREDIRDASSRLSRGHVQYDASKGVFYVSSGDNTALVQMAELMNQPLKFRAAGGLSGTEVTISQYGSAILANNAAAAKHNEQQLKFQRTLDESLQYKASEVSGVNLDEELAQLMIYQQAYAASGKVIGTTQQLFEILNDIIR